MKLLSIKLAAAKLTSTNLTEERVLINQYSVTIKEDVLRALNEDLGGSDDSELDVTAMLIASDAICTAKIITREDIVMCGKDWAEQAFLLVDSNLIVEWFANDGDQLTCNSTLAKITGNARAILTAERTALNFLQFLSATATTTYQYSKLLEGSSTQLLDTRKTIPGYRQAQKYAVKCGGGNNHRMGLYDAYLIKENHISACGGIAQAIQQARKTNPNVKIEVEVESLEELSQAIDNGADIVMLDNFSTELVYDAVSLNKQTCKLEVSGNITEERLKELAKTGVDYISSGAITKHVKAVDLSLLIS